MPRPGLLGATGLLMLVFASACAKHEPPSGIGRSVQVQLETIDERLRAIEERLAMCANLETTVEDLRQRLAAIEARQRAVATAPTPAGQAPAASAAAAANVPSRDARAGLWSRLASPEGAEQRAALAALGDEYRERKATLDEQLASATPAERQQALADLNKWYGGRLRELLGTLDTWSSPGAESK